jgi:hypothetical protein
LVHAAHEFAGTDFLMADLRASSYACRVRYRLTNDPEQREHDKYYTEQANAMLPRFTTLHADVMEGLDRVATRFKLTKEQGSWTSAGRPSEISSGRKPSS